MSTIHKALKKAQKEKEARFRDYGGILPDQRREKDRFFRRLLWWISLPVMACLLAFTAYSWFYSHDEQLPDVVAGHPETPAKAPAVKVTPAATVKEDIVKEMTVPDVKETYDKARAFHKNGRLINAKRLYQEVLNGHPGHLDALNNLGVILMHEKNYESAQRLFKQATHVDSDYVDSHYNLACVCALKGDAIQAVSHLKRAYSLNPEVKKWAVRDTDLKSLRGIPEFKDIFKTD